MIPAVALLLLFGQTYAKPITREYVIENWTDFGVITQSYTGAGGNGVIWGMEGDKSH